MKKLLTVFLAAAVAMGLTSCGKGGSDAASDVAYVQDKGNLVIGITE